MDPKTTTGGTTSGTTGTTGTTGSTGGSSSAKNLQDELMESARRVWLAGLGALATAGEEGARTFGRLVDRGKDVEHKSRETMGEGFEKAKGSARSTWNDLGNAMDETLTATLHRLGVPTRDEIRTLTARVEELSAKIDGLRARSAASSAAGAEHVVVDAAGNPVAGPGTGEPVVTPSGKTMGGV